MKIQYISIFLDTVKAVVREIYSRKCLDEKREKSQINNLNSHLRKVENKSKICPKQEGIN